MEIRQVGFHFSVYGMGESCQRTVVEFIFEGGNLKAATKINKSP